MKIRICEHNLYAGARCRKRATVAVQFRVEFGERLGAHGSTTEYLERVTFRCPIHLEVPDRAAVIGISDYFTLGGM
jgi:hypothetical protein